MTSLAHPSNLHKYLLLLDKRPSRALSQNFLIDANVVVNFVQRANLSSEDVVLEIGPGPGAFTQEIMKSGAKVIVIEKDAQFVKGLREQYKGVDSIQIIQDDFLTCDLERLLPQGKKIKVLSNLPFQLTSPILGKLFPLSNQIASCLFILQKEVADRILAKPKTKAFSSLTLFANFFTKPSFCFNISPTCFFPKPKVTSTALLFDLQSPAVKDVAGFFKLVRESFNHRRKMLSSTLPFPIERVQEALRQIGHSEKARPEELDLSSWIQLFHSLA